MIHQEAVKHPIKLFILLFLLAVSFDVLMPLVVILSTSEIQLFFSHNEISAFDLSAVFLFSLFLPKFIALIISYFVFRRRNCKNLQLKDLHFEFIRLMYFSSLILIVFLTLRVLLVILQEGYSLDLALNYRSGYLVKFVYILSSLAVDILVLSGRARSKIFRIGDLVFLLNQIVVIDKLMLGIFVFSKIAVVLVYSQNKKKLFFPLGLLVSLAIIYAGNRLMRGDDASSFFIVLYGYLIAPVIYLFTYVNFPNHHYFVANMISYSLEDNAIMRVLDMANNAPAYEAFRNTFELSRILNLNVSFNIYRFDGLLVEFSQLVSLPLGLVVAVCYTFCYGLIFYWVYSKSLLDRIAAVLLLVFLFFGFSDTSYDFYFSVIFFIFVLKSVSFFIDSFCRLGGK